MGAVTDTQVSVLSRLWQLREKLDKNTIICLLLLRKLSPNYQIADEQLTIDSLVMDTQDAALSAWDMVVKRQGGSYAAGVKAAIEKLAGENEQVKALLEDIDLFDLEEGPLAEGIGLFTNLPEDIRPDLVYETIIGWEAEKLPKATGDFYTPRQVAKCLGKIVEDSASLYDPCCGSGALLVAAAEAAEKEISLYGQTMDTASNALSRMNLILRDADVDLGTCPANTLAVDVHQNVCFDAVVSNPPFNQRGWSKGFDYKDVRWRYGLPPSSNANFAWLQHILFKLKEGCKAVVIMANSTLTTTNPRERAIRQGMLADGVVEAIIILPPNLFYNTKIPACIWVLKKVSRKEHPVLMIDLPKLMKEENKSFAEVISFPADLLKHWDKGQVKPGSGVIVATYHQIQLNGYVLSPNLYNKSQLPYIPLGPDAWDESRLIIRLLCIEGSLTQEDGDRLELLTHNAVDITGWQQASIGELYDIFGGLSMRNPVYGQGTQLVDVKTILHNHFVPQVLTMSAIVEQEKREKHNIRRGDILVNRTSENLKQLGCGCVADADMDAVYVGFAKRLRPRYGCDALPVYHRYAAGYFHSRIYRSEVENIAPVFTTRASLKDGDITGIPLYFPAMEWQKHIGDGLYSIHGAFQEATPRGQFMLRELQTQFVENLITNPILRWMNEGKDG